MGTTTNITKNYAAALSYLSILFLPGGTGMERAMANVASNGRAGKKELSKLISRLHGVATAMKSLSGDQPDFREKLQKLRDEVNTVCFRLRYFS